MRRKNPLTRRTEKRGAGGSVDYDHLGPPLKKERWYTLRARDGKTVQIYGYRSPLGWTGYDREGLLDAPCSHCGRVGLSLSPHICRGYWIGRENEPCAYDGMKANNGEHVCSGMPSMAWHGVKVWKREGWSEIPTTGFSG